jgi:hypothetical protein
MLAALSLFANSGADSHEASMALSMDGTGLIYHPTTKVHSDMLWPPLLQLLTRWFARPLSFLLLPGCTHSVGEIDYNIFLGRPICCATANRFTVIQFDNKQQSLDKMPSPEPEEQIVVKDI